LPISRNCSGVFSGTFAGIGNVAATAAKLP